MSKCKIKELKLEDLDLLDQTEAIVIEGLEEGSVPYFVNWASDLAGTVNDVTEVYEVKGSVLNEAWSLTGSNRYPDDLNIVAITFEQLAYPNHLAIPRFNVGGRWWSDIKANNLRREKENA